MPWRWQRRPMGFLPKPSCRFKRGYTCWCIWTLDKLQDGYLSLPLASILNRLSENVLIFSSSIGRQVAVSWKYESDFWRTRLQNILIRTYFMLPPFSLVNFSPNERVSVCVALDQNCRLWYVITSSKTTYYLLHIWCKCFRLEPRAKTVRFFGPIVCSQTKWIQFNELFELYRAMPH